MADGQESPKNEQTGPKAARKGSGQGGRSTQSRQRAGKCSLKAPGWDGYSALPISDGAIQNMIAFLRAIPHDLPAPSIGADPNGYLSAEWYAGPRWSLSVAVTEDSTLHYAALLGDGRAFGTTPPSWVSPRGYSMIPEKILDLARTVANREGRDGS